MEQEGGTGMKQALIGVCVALAAVLVLTACIVAGSIDMNDRLDRTSAELSRTRLQWNESKTALQDEKDVSSELREQLLSVQQQLGQREIDYLAAQEQLIQSQQETEDAAATAQTQTELAEQSAEKLEETETRLTTLAAEQELKLAELQTALDTACAERDAATTALAESEQKAAFSAQSEETSRAEIETLQQKLAEQQAAATLSAEEAITASDELQALKTQMDEQGRVTALIRAYKQKSDDETRKAAEMAIADYVKTYPQVQTDFLWDYLK